jgi:hypothetical protein
MDNLCTLTFLHPTAIATEILEHIPVNRLNHNFIFGLVQQSQQAPMDIQTLPQTRHDVIQQGMYILGRDQRLIEFLEKRRLGHRSTPFSDLRNRLSYLT